MSLHSRFLDVLLPRGGYAMESVESFFDESGTHDGAKSLCVSGFIFDAKNAASLSDEWKVMLAKYDLPYFHMSECAHNVGVYKHLSKNECDLSAREAIALIKKYACYLVCNSIEVAQFPRIPTDGLFSTAYTFLCWFSFLSVRHWANQKDYSGPIAYVFEAGADSQGEAGRFLEMIGKEPILKQQYRYKSHGFIEKATSPPLQCADILAWHWFTHLRRLDGGDPIRKDFASLIDIDNASLHFDEAQVDRFLQRTKENREELCSKVVYEMK